MLHCGFGGQGLASGFGIRLGLGGIDECEFGIWLGESKAG